MSSSNSWSYSDSFSSSRRSRQHGVFTFWVPVVLTTTLVVGGAAAWIWSQREEEDDDGHLSYGEDHTDNEHYGPRPPGAGGAAGGYESEGNNTTYTTATYGAESRYGESRAMGEKGGQETVVSRLTGGMIRRTPSPQQVFDVVSKRTAAGMAAAGAAVTGALSSIREEGNNGNEYEDHSRWSEEQILRRQREVEARSSESAGAVATNTEAFGAAVRAGASERDNKRSGARKTVAVVVSADTGLDNNDLNDDDARGGFGAEHASILSQLPSTNFSSTRLFVLIYAPNLREKSRPNSGSNQAPSMTSSYSAISTPAQTPGEELSHIDPQPYSGTPATTASNPDSRIYDALYSQAQRLVEKPTMVMPFTTPNGFVHMLRHLSPQLVYLTENLAGREGDNVEAIKGWVGQTVVVVGGDGAGLSGLVDTEDEAEGEAYRKGEGRAQGGGSRWWQESDKIGLGKGVEIVDGVRVGDDFERRLAGRD